MTRSENGHFMSDAPLSTPAILLRRTPYGDFDLIITLLTLSDGKLSVMAKSARKSVKRFGGMLEPFSILHIVCSTGPKQRLPILQEAALTLPLGNIRSDMVKTAHAAYWSEIIHGWLLEGKKEDRIFHLFQAVLEALDGDALPPALLSLLFQLKFLNLSGLRPNLEHCMGCGLDTVAVLSPHLVFDPKSGGLLCGKCSGGSEENRRLSKGTLKFLSFLEAEDISQVKRLRYSPDSLREGQNFLETVIPHHLGKTPNSLTFLRQLRTSAGIGRTPFPGPM